MSWSLQSLHLNRFRKEDSEHVTPKTSNPSQILHSALHCKIALVSLTGPKTS